MGSRNRVGARRSVGLREHRLFRGVGDPRRPVVAEPQGRQHVQLGLRRAAVAGRDLDQDVLGRCLGILHEHVEVAVLLEDPGVEELVLELVAAAPPVRLHQVGVRIGRLRVLVQKLHVRVGRRAVEVEVVLLDVLAVVAFAVREPEEALLQDRVVAVPQGEGEAEPLLVVADTPQAVLAPAIRPGTGVLVGEEVPGIAVVAVILAHRPPLPIREVRSPLPPGGFLGTGFLETTLLGIHLGPPWRSRYSQSISHSALVLVTAGHSAHDDDLYDLAPSCTDRAQAPPRNRETPGLGRDEPLAVDQDPFHRVLVHPARHMPRCPRDRARSTPGKVRESGSR